MSNDVEDISFALNRIDSKVGQRVLDEGLPKTLDLYSKHDIEATFFMLGSYVKKFPESIDLIKSQGHEIACHSYSHDYSFALDRLSLKQQIIHISCMFTYILRLSIIMRLSSILINAIC